MTMINGIRDHIVVRLRAAAVQQRRRGSKHVLVPKGRGDAVKTKTRWSHVERQIYDDYSSTAHLFCQIENHAR